MAETKREIERKYEATDETELPDLTRAAGVSAVLDRGVAELDAVYYDTADLRLAADALTLRRRTGGEDAGWHLKFPVAAGIRDEIRAPLADTLPASLAGLLRSRTLDEEVVPVVRLLSSRDVRHLVDDEGTLLAELSVDTVLAERLDEDGERTASWKEIEVELADGADPGILDAVEKRLKKAGVRPSSSPSKLARALEETTPKTLKETGPARPEPVDENTAGARVLAHVRQQIEAIVLFDPAVRRDLPDAVHKMRVATRRLRSAFKTYRKVLDRTVTDPIGEELKWLAGELGAARDQEVLAARLSGRIDEVPETLLLGPVRARLRVWDASRSAAARSTALAALESDRHLALLKTLDALLTDPPLRKAAHKHAPAVLAKAVLKDYDRLAGRVDRALSLAPGPERDLAMHEARKAAKRARYAAEAAVPTLGKPAKRFAKRLKAVQSVLGDHQDSVVARETLRTLAIQAHAAGESAFTWGLLHGREEALGAAREREFPEAWERASAPEARAAVAR
ncbi:CYTH and CHAD domain-containing protein [Streptomyces sp. ISL-36]|uniref:CYTH and CHAD domain-containing protein n=1 Tax=Streptomyces sp. ISL-36 TaxID=2819182 RepID=UPI001BE9F161|nr:CYTH and CHAD domain-containing protein [Streptomyces sp. ISL-36]MBT2439242.1 CYTH and CHAD domain-containing protein [Streptomyces sp. ISL-36]